MNNKQIIILSGPTASGKTDLALYLAQKIPAVIINCDSKQLYKEIPIITAQPSKEEQAAAPHKLYGCISASEHCSVGRWLNLVKTEIDNAHNEQKNPILVGGTGMYIKALLDGLPEMPQISNDTKQESLKILQQSGSVEFHKKLCDIDPEIAKKLQPNDDVRTLRAYQMFKQTGKSLLYWQQQKAEGLYPDADYLKFFLSPPREKVYENCNIRFHKMLENGVMDEIKKLSDMHLNPLLPAMKSHGVPELLAYQKGEMSLDEATRIAQRNTRHYIKRQLTWFRHQMTDTIALDNKDAYEISSKHVSDFIL